MILLSHPTANEFSRHLALSFLNKGLLEEFATCVHWQGGRLDSLIPSAILRELERRSFDARLAPKVRSYGAGEWGRLLAMRLKLRGLYGGYKSPFGVDRVYQRFDVAVAKSLKKKKDLSGIYAYEDGALESFRRAKGLGLKCYYDLPIAYWKTLQALIAEEAERYPQWVGTMKGRQDPPRKLERKVEELALADKVIVPSPFVADSLRGEIEADRIVLAPFGTPEVEKVPDTRKIHDVSHPLRILFAGTMTQRKGLADAFAAMKHFSKKAVELIVLGSPMASMEFYRTQYPDFSYEPTRPHAEVLKLMDSCDVLLLPSIVEGRALVMQEAMSRGLPLIITPNTGGEDLIDEGKTGFLVPIRTPEAIAEKIQWFLDHRELIPEMSRAAKEKVQPYTWTRYGEQVIEGIS